MMALLSVRWMIYRSKVYGAIARVFQVLAVMAMKLCTHFGSKSHALLKGAQAKLFESVELPTAASESETPGGKPMTWCPVTKGECTESCVGSVCLKVEAARTNRELMMPLPEILRTLEKRRLRLNVPHSLKEPPGTCPDCGSPAQYPVKDEHNRWTWCCPEGCNP
jgi:hypothetical protein